MEKNFLQLEENIPIFLFLEIIFRKILLSCSTKMVINCQQMIPHSLSDQNLQKLLEKDHIVLIVFWLDLKVMNPGFIGLTILAL